MAKPRKSISQIMREVRPIEVAVKRAVKQATAPRPPSKRRKAA